jgi:cysteine desulfurase
MSSQKKKNEIIKKLTTMENTREQKTQDPIYLDYNATTPFHPLVVQAMLPYLSESNMFGNPSSSHIYGVKTRKAVELARKQVAQLLGCHNEEILFTSGGSESNNYAIKGLAFSFKDRKHIITSKVEHVSVLEVCKYLEREYGYRVTYLDVDSQCFVDLKQLKDSLTPDTILVTIMHANNEVGTIQPIHKIGEILDQYEKETGVKIFFHTDASQSIGKVPISLYRELPTSNPAIPHADFSRVDLLTVCPHKFYGPKGVGALFIRSNTLFGKLTKQIHGASHEQNMRAGTENILEVVGLGKAAEVAANELPERIEHMKTMRNCLYEKIVQYLGNNKYVILNGPKDTTKCLPNTLNISFQNIESNTLLDELMDVIAASAGAACHSGDTTISYVLEAMNVPSDVALGAIRLSTGRLLTEKDVDCAAKAIAEAVKRLQSQQLESEEVAQIDIPSTGEVRLTSMTHGMGCGCKIRPQSLEKILKSLPVCTDVNVLVGTETSDDAGVYKLTDDLAVVLSVDFFTPMIDNAADFGAIASANALSDIYAMGAKPLTALNIVGFPLRRLPLTVLQEVLLGAQAKCSEAGVSVIGGHSIDNSEIFFGQSVTGVIHPDKIWKNTNSKPGDVLLLSKPIGVGIITTAIKRRAIEPKSTIAQTAIHTMSKLNKYVSERIIEKKFKVTACTDVTGFGLLGHLKEMIIPNKDVCAVINASEVPIIDGVKDLAMLSNLIPGGTQNNLQFVKDVVHYASDITETLKTILCDAQTSGGLLFTVPSSEYEQLLHDFQEQDIFIRKIGHIEKRTNYSTSTQIRVIL